LESIDYYTFLYYFFSVYIASKFTVHCVKINTISNNVTTQIRLRFHAYCAHLRDGDYFLRNSCNADNASLIMLIDHVACCPTNTPPYFSE